MCNRIAITGAGIAGLTTAIALQKIGITATVFEAAPEVRTNGSGLGLGANAIKALKYLGIDKEIIEAGKLLPAFTIYDQQGNAIVKTDSAILGAKYGLDNFVIHRAELHKRLLAHIDPACIQTNKRVESFTRKEDKIIILFRDGTIHETEFLIAADGIHSVIRQQVLPDSEIRYAGYTCWRAVIDNSHLQLEESSETWGQQGRFGIVPLGNRKIYWFACINAPRYDDRMKQFTMNDLQEHFNDFHAPIPDLLKQTNNEDLLWNDILDLKPVRQFAFGNVLLVGDAAHATTPNMGQGACQAMEDAVILAEEINSNKDISTAFKKFEIRRLKRTAWVVNQSWRVGKMAQLQNATGIKIRNAALRLLPSSFNERQFQKLYTVDF